MIKQSHGRDCVKRVVSFSLLIFQPPLTRAPVSAVSLPGCSAAWGHGCSDVILGRHLYLAQGAVKLILHSLAPRSLNQQRVRQRNIWALIVVITVMMITQGKRGDKSKI